MSAILETRPRWWILPFNRLIHPGVLVLLSFSCRLLNEKLGCTSDQHPQKPWIRYFIYQTYKSYILICMYRSFVNSRLLHLNSNLLNVLNFLYSFVISVINVKPRCDINDCSECIAIFIFTIYKCIAVLSFNRIAFSR